MAWIERRNAWARRYCLDLETEDCHPRNAVPVAARNNGAADDPAANPCLMFDV